MKTTIVVAIFLLLISVNTFFSQDKDKEPKKRPNQGLVFRLSEQDVIIPITKTIA